MEHEYGQPGQACSRVISTRRKHVCFSHLSVHDPATPVPLQLTHLVK